MRAAVFHEAHQPMTIETVEVAKPGAHEVLLNTAYAGLCHSELGHESSAVVEAFGSEVTYVKPGDRVIRLLQKINPFHDAGIIDQYIDRRMFSLQLTKCLVIPPAGEHPSAVGLGTDCDLPTDPRRATSYHNNAVAPGTARGMGISHNSTGASLSRPCGFQFQLRTQAVKIAPYGRHCECPTLTAERNATVPGFDRTIDLQRIPGLSMTYV